MPERRREERRGGERRCELHAQEAKIAGVERGRKGSGRTWGALGVGVGECARKESG